MGAAFSQTRTIYTSPGRVVQCSYEKAITTLHDPLTLIKMDPLAVSHQQSATDPDLWTIRDQLSILGFKYQFSFSARHTKYEDGVSFDVNAPLGIVMKDRWTISKADGSIPTTPRFRKSPSQSETSSTRCILRTLDMGLRTRASPWAESKAVATRTLTSSAMCS